VIAKGRVLRQSKRGPSCAFLPGGETYNGSYVTYIGILYNKIYSGKSLTLGYANVTINLKPTYANVTCLERYSLSYSVGLRDDGELRYEPEGQRVDVL
jgi:hypothetical protein